MRLAWLERLVTEARTVWPPICAECTGQGGSHCLALPLTHCKHAREGVRGAARTSLRSSLRPIGPPLRPPLRPLGSCRASELPRACTATRFPRRAVCARAPIAANCRPAQTAPSVSAAGINGRTVTMSRGVRRRYTRVLWRHRRWRLTVKRGGEEGSRDEMAE
jgi:hypothetical protein